MIVEVQLSTTTSRYARTKRYSKENGISLIEVLVTIVILSFGLLGVAGLLVGGVSNAAASEGLAKATQLAADMADRIRANPAVALSASSEYLFDYSGTAPTNPTTIALKDKKEWLEALARELPQGDGKITSVVSGGQRKIVIEVRWNNCFGTINDADTITCRDNSAAAFRYTSFELRL